MRTTVTLETDVAALLEREMKERRVTFKDAVNDAIRRGLGQGPRPDLVLVAHDLGATAYDLDHATALAAALEDEETVRRLNAGR